MAVTDGVDRAIDYYLAISQYIQEKGLPFRAIIAFSGERDHNEQRVSELSLNVFPSGKIPEMIEEDPYRILICAANSRRATTSHCSAPCTSTRPWGASRRSRTLSRLTGSCPTLLRQEFPVPDDKAFGNKLLIRCFQGTPASAPGP